MQKEGPNKRGLGFTVLTVAILVVAFFIIRQITALSSFTMDACDHFCPLLVSSHAIARNLKNDRGNLVYDSFYVLAKRKDPIAVGRAIELLQSNDDYTWLNAAMYLGACGRQEAVPFLIKALRHTAWRSQQQRAAYLQKITGQDFGVDFQKWKAWWVQFHPDFKIDWESHLGFSPNLDGKPVDLQGQ